MPNLADFTDRIRRVRASGPPDRSTLVGITGIDGCGKGYVTARLGEALRAAGFRVATIHIDGWLRLPHDRFDPCNPAEHFYLHAIRFEDLFAELVLPLRERRSLRLEADHTAETATAYLRHVYEFEDIDVIMLEGIFLLKREFARCYDLSIWLECGFDTALERAIARGQEGLPPEETARAYRTVYFPAQVIHFRRDEPKAAASLLVNNDPRLGPADWMS